MRRQVDAAIAEADLVLFVVDARTGATALDMEIAGLLRRADRPVVLVANKVESDAQQAALAELFRLGFGEPVPVSAEHGRGAAELLELARERAPRAPAPVTPAQAPSDMGPHNWRTPNPSDMGPHNWRTPNPVHIAIIGRPNAGKSSLVNAMVGAERVLVHDAPGTTRDAVDTAIEVDGRPYVLVDTAGIRRKGRVSEVLEKLSVVMALKSLERCQVALIVLDASEGLAAQDAHIAGYAHEAGRASILVVSKWDLVPPGMVRKAEVTDQLRERLPFVDYAPICFTSATQREGLGDLFRSIDEVAREARRRLPTAEVTAVVQEAIARRPISVAGAPLTLHSASQVAVAPPTFALRVNRPDEIHFSYERYLAKSLRRAFGFVGSPLRLSLRKAAGSRTRGVRR